MHPSKALLPAVAALLSSFALAMPPTEHPGRMFPATDSTTEEPTWLLTIESGDRGFTATEVLAKARQCWLWAERQRNAFGPDGNRPLVVSIDLHGASTDVRAGNLVEHQISGFYKTFNGVAKYSTVPRGTRLGNMQRLTNVALTWRHAAAQYIGGSGSYYAEDSVLY